MQQHHEYRRPYDHSREAEEQEPTERPEYGNHTMIRIRNARGVAAQSSRRAWSTTHNPRLHNTEFIVRSSHGKEVYTVRCYRHRRNGGYCYSIGTRPFYFITCTCVAAQMHNVPCRHAARVQLRMEREVLRGEGV